MSKRALTTWALLLIASPGCGEKAPADAKKIPPTPTAEDFSGASAPVVGENEAEATVDDR